MAAYKEENVNYIKFGFAIMKVTGDVLRQLFKTRHPNLSNFLIVNRRICQDLQRKKIFTRAELDIMYPKTGIVTLDDFDVTLLLHILTNISTITPPAQGWGRIPLASDTSLGADLVRLRQLRNYHAHNEKMEMENNEFGRIWSELEQILINIGGIQFKTDLDNFLSDPIAYENKIEPDEIPSWIKNRGERYLREAKNSERMFVQTRAFKYAMKRLKERKVITITGSFGSGKKFLASNIALILSKREYEVIPIINSQEILECHRRDKKQLFVINDPLGSASLDSRLFYAWKEQYDKVQSIIDTSLNTKVIFTFRSAIFKHRKCKMAFEFMYREEVNISDGRYGWDEKEKQVLLRNYGLEFLFDSYDDIHDRSLPLLCQKASESYRVSQKENLRDTTPKEMFKIQLEELLENSPCNYFVLLVVMAYQNNFNVKKALDYVEINKMSTLFDIPLPHLFYDQLDDILQELEGTFLVVTDGAYSFASFILYDIITFNAGRIAPEFVVHKCSSEYFCKKIMFESSYKQNSALSLSLKEDMFDAWFKRMVFEIHAGCFLPLLFSETFLVNEKLIMKKFYTLQTNEIHKILFSESVEDLEISDVLSKNIRHVLKYFSNGWRLTPLHVFLMLGRTDLFLAVLTKVKKLIPKDETYIIDLLKASLIGGSTKCLDKISKLNSGIGDRFKSLFRRGKSLLSECEPLCITCACDNLEMTKYLIQSGYSINACNKDGDSPLALAAYFHNSKTTAFILNEDIEINSKNKEGLTPLMMAIENDTIMEKLLSYKNVDLRMTTNEGQSVLMMACAFGKRYIIVLLLQKMTSTIERERFVNQRNKNGATAIFMACECKKEVSDGIVSTLLTYGAGPNITENTLGSSPLHIAVASGSLSLVQLLLNNDARVNCADKDGVTPLFIAAERGFRNIFEMLIDHGANITVKRHSDNASALLISSEFGHEEIVSIILRMDRTSINEPNVEGSTPLLLATLNNNTIICELLIAYKADANISNQNGYSPMTVAARNCNIKLLDLYLQNGFDLNSRTQEGYSSLHLACMMGNLKTVEYLINQGADAEARDIKGNTPLHYASVLKHDKICSILKTSLQKQDSPPMSMSSIWSDDISTPSFDAEYDDEEISDHVFYRREEDTTDDPYVRISDISPLNADDLRFLFPKRGRIAGSSIRSKVYSDKGSLRELFNRKRN